MKQHVEVHSPDWQAMAKETFRATGYKDAGYRVYRNSQSQADAALALREFVRIVAIAICILIPGLACVMIALM